MITTNTRPVTDLSGLAPMIGTALAMLTMLILVTAAVVRMMG